ncbi:hypothetical protein N8T08_005792 [Aspergillus melleus]|uniref:Uncharacterized protein n=1 Tax=Aspergillus melleus TaxID=138277 RepID=A0ACC3B2B7_9EURO|nr:hypothetical protein N8T08_005792 [Aspergillus melleus]
MDEALAPNLTAAALSLQGKEVFTWVVKATFPGTYATFGPRCEPSWTEFIWSHPVARSPAVIWCQRCINTWFLARRHNDATMLATSRDLYNRGLQSLVCILGDPTMVTSDTVLTTAVMLGVYEMFDGLGPHSWLIHSRGIATLFRLRGPKAHQTGFGRTLYVTFRSFFVAEAFLRQEPCFLAGAEWREVNLETAAMDEAKGKGSRLGAMVERVFNETVLCPGYFQRTSELMMIARRERRRRRDRGRDEGSTRHALVLELRHSVDRLRDLQQQLGRLADQDQDRDWDCGQPVRPGVDSITGPIPQDFVHRIARASLQGIGSAIALLEQLTVGLQDRWSDSAPSWSLPSVRSIQELEHDRRRQEGRAQSQSEDWIDQLAMSMGTLAIKTDMT